MADQRRCLRRLLNRTRKKKISTKKGNINEQGIIGSFAPLDRSSSTQTSSSSSLTSLYFLRCSLDQKSSFKRSSSANSHKKSVRFSSIQIREHELTMDVNPAVSSGPAISLSWNYRDLPTFDIKVFEQYRLPHRRCKSEFQMPRHRREFLLREEFGFTRSDIRDAINDIRISQKQRYQSQCDREKAVELAEWFQCLMLKLTRKQRTYEEDEALLWKQAQLWRQAMINSGMEKRELEKVVQEDTCNSSCALSSKSIIDPHIHDKHVSLVSTDSVARQSTSNAAA